MQEGNLEDLLPDVISNDFVIDHLLGFLLKLLMI